MPAGATGFEQTYPNIADWVKSYGWIEIGNGRKQVKFLIDRCVGRRSSVYS
jgi:hypothetical protein